MLIILIFSNGGESVSPGDWKENKLHKVNGQIVEKEIGQTVRN